MCGIFAYTGDKQACPIVLDGLTTLEYRGYDSAGIYFPGFGVIKTPGAVGELRKRIQVEPKATSGIAHLRWATHGEPTEQNAHPHQDCSQSVSVVHNGIIENFRDLRSELLARGHTFSSDTDTEVIPHLIEEELKAGASFEESVIATLGRIRGTYGLVIASANNPGTIIAARMGAPVVVGLGNGENFVASDATPILRHTKEIIFLSDGDIAIISPSSHRIRTIASSSVSRAAETVEWDVGEASRGGYPHFMLKEIFEAPEVIQNALRGRLRGGYVKLGGLESVQEQLRSVKRIIITGCGTAYYAGLLGEYLIEDIAGIPVEVEFASEFRYRHPVIEEGTALIAVSQSGETADTLEAVCEAKKKGVLTLGVVNAVGSTIARETDAGVYNHAGPEIGVASTKGFISQVIVLTLIALFLGGQRRISPSLVHELEKDLGRLPELVQKILAQSERIHTIAEKYRDMRDMLYIGRRYSYPVALEGALKLKEVSYIHAEGYGAGEMKHGPLAMIDPTFPTLAIVPHDSVYDKTLSNMIEIRARRGPIIAIATEGDDRVGEIAEEVVYIPKVAEPLTPILSSIALQLFAYHTAASKKLNVDRPRNLAKSVTVE